MLYCFQEKETGVVQFLGEGIWCTYHYCSQDRKRKLVLYFFQEKGSGALLFSKKGKLCSTVFRRMEQVLYCF